MNEINETAATETPAVEVQAQPELSAKKSTRRIVPEAHPDDISLLNSTSNRAVSLQQQAVDALDKRLGEIDNLIQALRGFRSVLVEDRVQLGYAKDRAAKVIRGVNAKNIDEAQAKAQAAVTYGRSMVEKMEFADELICDFLIERGEGKDEATLAFPQEPVEETDTFFDPEPANSVGNDPDAADDTRFALPA